MAAAPARHLTRLIAFASAIVIGVALAVLHATPATAVGEPQYLPISATARIGSETLMLEVARTADERSLGLMFRPELPRNRGMLFPTSPPRVVRMWMKNVPVALDMVFVRDGRVIALAEQVPPCRETPCPAYGPTEDPVDAVVELRAGRISELGLTPGDPIVISEGLDPSDAAPTQR